MTLENQAFAGLCKDQRQVINCARLFAIFIEDLIKAAGFVLIHSRPPVDSDYASLQVSSDLSVWNLVVNLFHDLPAVGQIHEFIRREKIS